MNLLPALIPYIDRLLAYIDEVPCMDIYRLDTVHKYMGVSIPSALNPQSCRVAKESNQDRPLRSSEISVLLNLPIRVTPANI